MSLDPIRKHALDILVKVERGAHLDTTLERILDRLAQDGGDQRSRGFLAELVRGTIQWQGRYDHVIASFSRRKPPADIRLRILLRLSLHQLLGQDGVPAYAAIHQAGELCKHHISAKKVGYINGLLQAVRREILVDSCDREQCLAPLFAPLAEEPAAWLSAWYSHPRWLVERWLERFGRDGTEALCAFNNRSPSLTYHVLPPTAVDEAAERLAAEGCPVRPGRTPRALITEARPARQTLIRVLGMMPGLIVQDESVQEAGAWLTDPLVAGAALDQPPPAGPVLDLCAAPGGKTAHLAAAFPDRRIVAMDLRRSRMRTLADTVRRIGAAGVSLVQADGLQPPFVAGGCAVALLDGPCSGTGVLRHHPDGRWLLEPDTPERNGRLLGDLLARSVELLAPGGYLLYATCSLEPEENLQVVESVLRSRDDLEPAPGAVSDHWWRQWLPQDCASDGFFAARLRVRSVK